MIRPLALAVGVAGTLVATCGSNRPVSPARQQEIHPSAAQTLVIEHCVAEDFLLLRVPTKEALEIRRSFNGFVREKAENTLRPASYSQVLPEADNFRKGLGAFACHWDDQELTFFVEDAERGGYTFLKKGAAPPDQVYLVFCLPKRPPEPPPPTPQAETETQGQADRPDQPQERLSADSGVRPAEKNTQQ